MEVFKLANCNILWSFLLLPLLVDECASAPCHNGGECTDEYLAFSCNCVGTNHTGDWCQEPLHIGESHPLSIFVLYRIRTCALYDYVLLHAHIIQTQYIHVHTHTHTPTCTPSNAVMANCKY